MARKRNRKVPAVLWRLFRHRARSLAETVMSLVSLQSLKAESLLVQPQDPADYIHLLRHCFVVVNHDAPPASSAFHPRNRWNQRHIVRRTAEMLMHEHPKSPNTLYSSLSVDLLTDPAWTMLLERVGDDLMIYLLKNTSMFLPVPRNKHYQATGHPISSLILERKAKSKRKSRGTRKKRDRINNANEICKRQKLVGAFSDTRPDSNGCQESDMGSARPETGIVIKVCEESSNEPHEMPIKPSKRSRPFKWHRLRRSRHLDCKNTTKKTCIGTECTSQHIKRCSSCLLSRASGLVTERAYISRQPMFYNVESSSYVLPGEHVLNSVRPCLRGSKSIIQSIFGLYDANLTVQSVPNSRKNGFCLTGCTCLHRSLVNLFKVLIRRSHYCNHLVLLDKHCAVSSVNQNNMLKSNSEFEIEVLKSFCSKSQVVSYIWAVCRSIVPSDLLGSPSNWRSLRRNIARFIQLRKFERFSLKQCMHKLKTSEFPFLSHKQSSCCFDPQVMSNRPMHSADIQQGLCKQNDSANILKRILLQKWIYWLFSCLVVPLVQANFYVTESQRGKQDIYFYRKPIWENLRNRAITCFKDQNYKNLGADAVNSVISCRSFGFSKLRLLPKHNGVRWIANLKSPSKVPTCVSSTQAYSFSFEMQKKAKFWHKDSFKHVKSANYFLRDTHAVLRGLLLKEPKKLGSSVFDYNDIYRNLCRFMIDLKNGSANMPAIFIVVADVSKAFDSIDQDKLVSVMKDIICEDEYVLKQFSQVFCTKKSMWVREHLTLSDENISSGSQRHIFSLCGSLQCILVNQEGRRYLKREELLFNLNELVKHHIFQCDKKFYVQGTGIPQGSILSPLLCSLYYGHLEINVIFPYLEKTHRSATNSLPEMCSGQDVSGSENILNDKVTSSPGPYMLLRLIDDILFVSTSQKLATSMFHRLLRGFRDYNCYMNEEKFCLNFDNRQVTGVPLKKLCSGEDGISFLQWSGLLLNSRTFEVQADYTRYLNNHISSSLTVRWQDKPAYHLKMALINFMRPKCHPLFCDSNINSEPVVRLNIYQAFLVSAMKFHCYVSQLSYICKLRTRAYFNIITSLTRYVYMLIKKRMRAVHFSHSVRPVLQLEAREVEWLGLYAFTQVLKRKQSRHRKLLSLLRLKVSKHGRGAGISASLKYAVDKSHSSLIWKIKY